MDILEKMTGNVSENTACWNAVETAIESHGVDVPEGTPKSDYAEKVNAVYEAGKQSEYDFIWDVLQQNGDRKDYRFFFYGCDTSKIYPKYQLTPTGATDSMFRRTYASEGLVLGANVGRLYVDFSKVSIAADIFQGSEHEHLGVLDFSSAEQLHYAFHTMPNLHTIDMLKINGAPKQGTIFISTFNNTPNLQNILIDGYIVQNGFNVQWSTKLSKASIESIINALSPTTTGLTVTLSKTAVENAFAEKENLFDFQSLTGIVDDIGDSLPSYGVIDKVNEIYTSNIGVYAQNSYLYPPLTLPAGEYTLSTQVYLDHEKETEIKLCIKGSEGAISSKYVNDIPDKEWTDESISFVLNEPTEIYIGLQSVGGAANYRNLNVQFKDIKIERNEWAELVASKPNWTISLV